MSALRQEAIAIVNNLPEQYLATFVQNIKDFVKNLNPKKKTMHPDLPFTQEEWDAFVARQELDPKKVMAFDNMERFLSEHPINVNETFDYNQERWEAISEKYGSIA